MRLQEVYEEAEVGGFTIPIPSRIQVRCIAWKWHLFSYVFFFLSFCFVLPVVFLSFCCCLFGCLFVCLVFFRFVFFFCSVILFFFPFPSFFYVLLYY